MSYSRSDDEPTPTPEPEPPEMSVTMNRSADGTVDAAVSNARAGEPVALEPPAVDGLGVRYRALNLTFGADGDYALSLRASETPANVPALSVEADGAAPMGYLEVAQPNVSAGNVSGASITYEVDKGRLAAANATADDVALYRYHDGEWAELNAKRVGATADAYVFESGTPGLSTFAVGAKRPAIRVADVTLSDSTLGEGETVTVTARVVNEGGAAGSYTVELTAFGEVVDERTLTLDAGEERSVTFVQRVDSPGYYDLAVGGRSATLEVTGTTTGATTESSTTTNGEGQPGFGSLAAIVALAALLAVARRRN